MPDPEESVLDLTDEGKAAEAAKAAKAAAEASRGAHTEELRNSLVEEFDKKLKERDQSILKGMTDLAESMKEAVISSRTKPTEEPEIQTSPQEFFNDPMGAMEKFFAAKVGPELKKMQEGKAVENDTGLRAIVEVRKSELKTKYGDEYRRYEPFFEQVLQRTDPRVVAEPLGMDAVYRLAKSYGEEALQAEEKKRTEIGRKANLETSGKAGGVESQKVDLSADEARVAAAFGLSPELYKKYDTAEEVEIGANRKEKKK